ncbi:MAG: hypothetical protein JO360_03835 [Acidobacteria bacterium]|nr:hypothetical protein [Acidobacteriota bacterium]
MKAVRQTIRIILGLLLLLSTNAFALAQVSPTDDQVAEGNTISSARAKQLIAARARETILALKRRDMAQLAGIVHPTKGVRFTPYNYIDVKEDLVFRRAQVKGLMASRKRYLWGSYDGSGDPIRLTFRKYYEQFVYDWDFASDKDARYNVSARTNTNYDNAYEVYPNSIIVEYLNPGTVESGMDWSALRLVFEKQGGTWYLVGVLHNEWTI